MRIELKFLLNSQSYVLFLTSVYYFGFYRNENFESVLLPILLREINQSPLQSTVLLNLLKIFLSISVYFHMRVNYFEVDTIVALFSSTSSSFIRSKIFENQECNVCGNVGLLL
jgi:hypothetical protein